MKLIIEISQDDRMPGLIVSDFIKMPAIPTISKSGYADTTGMSVRFYNANKHLLEEFAQLAKHLKEEAEKFHQAYGELDTLNSSTTGNNLSNLASSSLETSNETTEPSTI